MTGVSITIDTVNLRASLHKLQDRMGNLQPLFDGIGQAVVSETLERFRKEEAPDGSKWHPSQRAANTGGKTLTHRGHLRDSITYRAQAEGVEVGTNRVYAAIHQFGFNGTQSVPAHERRILQAFGKPLDKPRTVQVKAHSRRMNLVARPFLGIGANEQAAIEDQIMTHLEGIGS
jgi:phage virion morphogenesis protein